MRELIWVDEGPLRSKIQLQLEQSSKRLKKLECAIEGYFARDLPQYQGWLSESFSHLIGEIQELENKTQKLSRRIQETTQLSIEMEINPAELYAHVANFAHQDEDLEEPENCFCAETMTTTKIAVSKESKEIFRRLARALHPDIRKDGLSDNEKNMWVAARNAYVKNNSFELLRLEKELKSGEGSTFLAFSEIRRQIQDFEEKEQKLRRELEILQNEKAWNFSARKDTTMLERELEAEFLSSLSRLQKKEQHLLDTVEAWQNPQEKCVSLPKKRRGSSAPKAQASLFDA